MPDSNPNHVRRVYIDRLPIQLHQFLKFESLVASGGEAKMLITQGRVRVNAEVETRRGKKLQAGDVVTFEGRHYEIIQAESEP
jgi:ribosome-associated protein